MSEKNTIKVYTTSNGAELNISAPSTKQVISATNNRAQYFAEQAKKYKEEAKQYRDNAKFYAEQNSDVTYEYIEQIKGVLEEQISEMQPAGNYALKEELPINVSELTNDAEYVNKEELNNAISEVELPSQEGCEGLFLMSDGKNEVWVGLNSFQLFDTKTTDFILLEPDSHAWALQGTYVYKEAVAGSRYGYPDFYSKCLEEKGSGTATEVTLGESTITMYVHSNGHQFYDIADKEAIDTWFETYGSAWFYGIDIENERIFLPRKVVSPLSREIVSKTVSGSTWCTVYSDGWIEQGGRSTGSSTVRQVYFTKPFKDTSYNISLGAEVTDGGNNANAGNVRHKYTTNFYLYTPFGSNPIDWRACGYGEVPETQKEYNNLYICVGNTESQSTIIDVVDVTTTENDTIPLFTAQYFDFTPNNVSWLKAGGQANSGEVYSFAYNELVNELTAPKYGLKVIDVADIESGVDYSGYWKVNQDEITFITPLVVSSISISEESTAQLYFKVANAVQNLELLDAGEVLEAVGNIVPNNKELIMDYVVPDILNQISYSVTSNTIIDFPVNGWIRVSASPNASFAMGAKGATSTAYCPYRYYRNQEAYQELWMPVAKGEYTILDAVNVAEVIFIPMKGAS